MAINKDSVITELGLKRNGAKGWYQSNETVCPECERWDKAGILFVKNDGVFRCMRCGVNKPLDYFLKDINRSDLVEYDRSITLSRNISLLNTEVEEEEKDLHLPIKRLPMGCKPIIYDKYLCDRKFLTYHFNLFKPMTTDLDIRSKNTIIFQIFDECNRRVAWLSRSRESKEWHKENLKLHKDGLANLKLRYDNSLNTDFSKILGGYQEITENTDTLILVEGLFDKVPVDYNLKLNKSEEIKCNFLFGSDISDGQIALINRKPQIKTIYLLLDNGTLEKSKHYGALLYYKTNCKIFICEITKIDADPGDLNREELFDVISESVNFLQFKVGKIDYVS
jgi:hypothetical protein